MPDADAGADMDVRVGRTLFCKGLTQQVTQSILYELFLIAGPIQCIHLPRARPWETKEGGALKPAAGGKAGSTAGKKVARPRSDRIGQPVGERAEKRGAVPNGKGATEDVPVVKSKDHPQHRKDVVDEGALSAGGKSGSKAVIPAVGSNEEEKPYSVDDKILYRYRLGEHQGYAFIVYFHVKSVDYAINVFRGTKLFGSQISMSPAMQAMDKAREFSKSQKKDSKAAKSKSEIRQRQTNAASQRNTQGVGRNRDVYNRNLNFQGDQISFERHLLWNGARMAQHNPPGRNYSGTNVYGSGNWQNDPYAAANAPRTVQGNWRAYSDGYIRGFAGDAGVTCDSRQQWQYLRGTHAPHDEYARNSFGNAIPRPQARSYHGSQRRTVLHANIPQLGRSTFETGNPIIESGSFLPLTPDLTQEGYNLPREMTPPLVATEHGCSPTVNPPCTPPFDLTQPQPESPLTLSGDEQIPILYYEMDTKPDNQPNSSNIYIDGQAGTENWDPPTPMCDNAHLMTSLTLNQDGLMPEHSCDGGGDEQLAHLVPNGLSPPQLHYQLYVNDEFASCEPTPVTHSQMTFNEMQYLHPNHLNNPYVQPPFQGYGTEFNQWQPPHPHGMQGHVLNGHRVNHFDQAPQQILNQFRLLNLGYDSSCRPAEQVTYTRVFGQGVEHDPAVMAFSDGLAPGYETPCSEIDWQNDPSYYLEPNTKELLHRSQSVPCHVSQATKSASASRARSTHSSGNLEEGNWVSPVTWRSGGHGTWPNPAQRRPDRNLAGRMNRPWRNYSPLKNRPFPSPRGGSAKKPERRYTLSECLDSAFEAYHQGNAVNSPRSSKQTGGGSSRKSSAF